MSRLAPNSIIARAPPTSSSLFPISRGISSWTTFSGLPDALPLNNNTLRPVKVASGLPVRYENAPDGKLSLRVHYPKGSYRPGAEPRGGISFYSHGPASFDFTRAQEATLGYSVWFPPDFDWVRGGKLPGLLGGNSKDEAYGCSGGRKDTNCWSARLVWRAKGVGEIYAYLPPYDIPGFEANKALCSIPQNTCDDSFGISIGRGNFTLTPGAWTTVAERVKLNDVGRANGEMDLFVDGRRVLGARNIIIRPGAEGKIQGVYFSSFFGGSTPDWATPKDQDIYIADVSVAIIKEDKTSGGAQAQAVDEEEGPSGSPVVDMSSETGTTSPLWSYRAVGLIVVLQFAAMSLSLL